NGNIEKALSKAAKENGFQLSNKGAERVRSEMSLSELKQLNDDKRTQDQKLDVLEEIARRVIANPKEDESVKKELQQMIDARQRAKKNPPSATPTPSSTPSPSGLDPEGGLGGTSCPYY